MRVLSKCCVKLTLTPETDPPIIWPCYHRSWTAASIEDWESTDLHSERDPGQPLS